MFRMLKLNPPNGWRAVVWELAIVTLGVLIALAAQQWVEDRSWRQKAGDARIALREELRATHYRAVEWRVVEPCIQAQLDRLEKRVVTTGNRLEPAPIFRDRFGQFNLRTPGRNFINSVWASVIDEGISSRLASEERQGLAAQYHESDYMGELGRQMRSRVTSLMSLSRPLELDPAIKLSLLQTIDQVRGNAADMAIIASYMVGRSQQLNVSPKSGEIGQFIEESGTFKFCRSQNLPTLPLVEATRPPQ